MVQTGCCLHKCHNSTAAATAAAKHHAGTASTRAAAPPPQMRCSAHCVAHTCCTKAHSCHALETCIRNPHHDTITLGPSLQDSTDTLRNTQIGKQDTAARNHHTTASIMEPLIPVNHISMVQIPSHMLNHGSTHLHSTHNASPQRNWHSNCRQGLRMLHQADAATAALAVGAAGASAACCLCCHNADGNRRCCRDILGQARLCGHEHLKKATRNRRRRHSIHR